MKRRKLTALCWAFDIFIVLVVLLGFSLGAAIVTHAQPAAPDLLQMLRDVDAHFAAHFGEQAWATSEIGGMTRVSIAKATGGAV